MKRLLIIIIALSFAVPVAALGLYLGFHYLTTGPISWARTAAFRNQMRQVGEAIEHYRNTADGRIPTMSELIELGSLILPATAAERRRLCETFEIVPLSMCVVEEGNIRDAYVLYAKVPPKVQDWGLIVVDGKEVSIR